MSAEGDASPKASEGGSQKAMTRRPSLNPDTDMKEGAAKLAQGERRLSVSTLRVRADLELWLMTTIPALMGVSEDDTDNLPEALQEDGQSGFCAQIIFDKANLTQDEIRARVHDHFSAAKEREGWPKFEEDIMRKIEGVRISITDARKNSKSVPECTVPSPRLEVPSAEG